MTYADLSFGLSPYRTRQPYPPVYEPYEERHPVDGVYAPTLRIWRWRWSGIEPLFDLLDADSNGAVDEIELEKGLGRGLDLLRGETSGPLDAERWRGHPEVFRLIDADGDGRVRRREIAMALGPHAVRLAHGHPAHGPPLPRGARYRWIGKARQVVFPSREAKARYMAEAAVHDAGDPAIRSWARQFTSLPPAARAEAILRFVQRCIRYTRDPAWYDKAGRRHGIELLDSSSVGLQRGYGDCDLKARLFVALCLASGLRARIDPVFEGTEGFPHVRARVYMPSGETGAGEWEVADPTIVNSSVGKLPPRSQIKTNFPEPPPPRRQVAPLQ
jgi:transglutaminase-like putative cysteine protease